MRQIFEHHSRIGHRFVPGLKTRVNSQSGGYLLRANQTGFRNDFEFIEKKQQGKKRILIFGDSFTAGDGVSNGKRYSDFLAPLLPNTEIYNFGLPGTGTDQQYLAYQEYGAALEHDVLVIAVLVENIRRVAARYRYYSDGDGNRVCYAKPYFELNIEGNLQLGNVPVPAQPVDEEQLLPEDRNRVDKVVRFPLLNKLMIKTNTVGLAQKLTKHNPFPQYERGDNPDWLIMRAILERWINESNVPVLLIPVPFYYYIEEICDPAGYQARFQEVAKTTGCALHDPLPDLLAYSMAERRKFRFPVDVHPTSAGHAALAKSLAPAIEKQIDIGHSTERQSS